jgi:hypothetical protein
MTMLQTAPAGAQVLTPTEVKRAMPAASVPSDPDEIVALVEQRFMDFEPIHTRMDRDFEDFRLAAFRPVQGEGVDQKDAYTANTPYVLAKQVISYIAQSELIVQVPNRRADEMRREANQAKEQFVYGLIEAVDEQFLERADPRLIAQIAAFSVIRGPVTLRRLLRKDKSGETYPDAVPMDPRWVVFTRDSQGIRWACHKIRKSRDEVSDTYQVALDPVPPENKDDGGIYCYDFYWRKRDGTSWNCVISDSKFVKRPARVFSEKFPIVVIGGDDLPMLQSGDTNDRTIAQWAESVFAANRSIWAVQDRAASYELALMARSVDQVILYYSQQGDKVPEENPNKKGGVIPMSVQNQEKMEPLPLTEMVRDAQAFNAKVQRHIDMGGLPPHAMGILDQPLSGVALRQLGARIEHVIRPFLRRTEQAVKLVAEGWCADFKTGYFRPLTVYGVSHNRQPFELEATPEVLEMAGRPRVRLVPNLPEDKLENVSIAEQLTRPNPKTGESLVSYRYARDNVLQVEDSEWVGNEVMEQMARSGSPYAQAMAMAQAAFKAGDQRLAQHYAMQAQMAQMQMMQQMMVMQMQFGQMMGAAPGMQPGMEMGGAPGQPPGPAEGVDPRMLQATRFGVNPDTASPDAGYAASAERPGAQDERTRRLRSVGIEPGA